MIKHVNFDNILTRSMPVHLLLHIIAGLFYENVISIDISQFLTLYVYL